MADVVTERAREEAEVLVAEGGVEERVVTAPRASDSSSAAAGPPWSCRARSSAAAPSLACPPQRCHVIPVMTPVPEAVATASTMVGSAVVVKGVRGGLAVVPSSSHVVRVISFTVGRFRFLICLRLSRATPCVNANSRQILSYHHDYFPLNL